MTAKVNTPLVAFLIGVRFNKLIAIRKWIWFLNIMPAMLRELDAKPDVGMLWYRTHISWRMILVQQYWESFDKLLAYAQDRSGKHFPAWARFTRGLSQDGSVGIWHETYLVEPGKYECIYDNMPSFGQGAVTGLVRAEGRLMAAKDRFAG